MKKRVKRKLVFHILYSIALLAVLLINIFSDQLEILLKLKPNITNSQATQVHFIDVGQGDAVAINLSNGQVMLVDSGISEYRDKLTSYLDNVVLKDDKTIDYLVLTHPDIDHSANMEYILENYKVKKFYRPEIYEKSENKDPFCENETYGKILDKLDELEIDVVFNIEQTIIDDNISIKWLNVLDRYEDINDLDTNQFSPIIIIEDNDKKLMLTGDIDADAERLYIEKYGDILDIDILKLAHHGSKYSNSEEFLNAVTPEYVIACVGENTYGHPASDTINRLIEYDETNNTRIYETFKSTLNDGNVIYTMEEDIHIDEIDNIDNYNFVDFWVYSTIMALIIMYFYIKPYLYVWKRNIRFYIQNKQFEKYLQKEKELRLIEKGKNSTNFD